METAMIGSLRVSRVGFGCYGMGGAYGPTEPAVWEQQVRLALDLGITFFDVAAAYGEAEGWLGRWLAPRRDEVVIATKFGIGDDLRTDASAAAVIRACEASLSRLGTEWIDLYQVHFDDPSTPTAETTAALDALRRQGKIREYGVGHLPAPRVAEYLRAGTPAGLLLELSLLAQDRVAQLAPLASEHGASMIAFSPTGRGLLTGQVQAGTAFGEGDIRRMDPLFATERREAGVQLAARLAEVGRELGASAAGVAIAWVLAQPGVAAALTGPSRPEHLRQNAAAAELVLPDELVAELGREGRRLGEQAQRAAIAVMYATLDAKATGDAGEMTRRLLGAMETAIGAGLATEEAVTPLALRLLRPGREGRPLGADEFDEIRADLAGLVHAAKEPREGSQ